MKMDAPLSVPHCYGRSRNRDGPSDRNCSRPPLQFRARALQSGPDSPAADWPVPFRRLKTESFSFVFVFVLQRYGCRRYSTARGLAFPLQKLRTLIFDEQGITVVRPNPFTALTGNGFHHCNQAHTASSITKNPVSPPPEVTLTIGVADRRTIAPQTFPRKRNGFVSTNIGCNFQSVSPKIGNTSGCKSSAFCTM